MALGALLERYRLELALFVLLFVGYAGLAWLISGSGPWWNIGFVSGVNIFYGDDAYRFFLSRSLWRQPQSLFAYNFNLPVNLLLENAVISLAGGSLFVARLIHAFISVGALYFFWRGGLALGISRSIMLASMLVLGLTPLYAFLSLSFYGEAWLTFALCLLVYLFATNKLWWLTLVAGCLPLIRPEGILYLIPFWIYLLREKPAWRGFLILVPGGLYLLFLLWYLPDLHSYMSWRISLRDIYRNIDGFNDWRAMLLVCPPWLTVPALLSVLSIKAMRCWPLLTGAFLWVLLLVGQFITGSANAEPRYLLSLLPVMVLFWAFSLHWLCATLPKTIFTRKKMSALIGGIALLSAGLGFSRLSILHAAVSERGWGWTVGKVVNWEWKSIYSTFLPSHMASYHQMSQIVVDLTNQDAGIDRVVMFDHFMYYFLDPYALPERVSVEYPAVGYMVFHQLTAGQVFTQHPGGHMYSYLNFGLPGFSAGERRALYIDLMPMPTYPYRWEIGPAQMYLFSYEASIHPPVDLENVEPVSPDDIIKTYRNIFGDRP